MPGQIMTEFDPRNPLSRPKTPPKTSWFEFLLDKSLLETHLAKEGAEPSAAELLMLFLYQAEVAAATAREINKDDEPTNDTAQNSDIPIDIENKKVRALKLLALKVGSFLKWNQDTLEKSVPLAMVQGVLGELLNVTYPGDASQALNTSVDLASLPPQALFALLMYHCWCLRTVVKDTFPIKPSKVANVQVPGLLDPSIISANLKENVMKMVKDMVEDSVLVLERYIEASRDVCMPTVSSISIVNEESDTVEHDWMAAHIIPAPEMVCQVCYDLGSMYFHRQQYKKAFDVFQQARQLYSLMSESVFCHIDQARLDGYCTACSGIVGKTMSADTRDVQAAGRPNLAEPNRQTRSILTQAEATRKSSYQGLTDVLLEDNTKLEMSLPYRIALEDEVYKSTSNERQKLEVTTCNIVRKCLDNRITPTDYTQLIVSHPSHASFLIQTCEGISGMSFSQKCRLKYFLRYLCYTLPGEMGFIGSVMNSPLHQLFPAAEIAALRQKAAVHKVVQPLEVKITYPEPSEDSLELGELERQLLVSYQPADIKQLTQRLSGKLGKYQAMFLTNKWRIPREFYQLIDGLPVPQPSFQVYTHLLVAKARICLQLQLFEVARELFSTAECATKDVSYKLSRLLRWEVLRTDLLQHQHIAICAGTKAMADLIKLCKTCVTTQQLEHDLGPSQELLSHCSAFLLNVKEWDYLCSASSKKNGYLELAQLIAAFCKELPQMKNARKSARELWEAVTMVYTNSVQQKRSSSGVPSLTQRDTTLGVVPQHAFMQFVVKLKEPVIVSAMISLMTKLYNILKDDITVDISSDFVTLWPTALASAGSMNTAAVVDTVSLLMEHSHEINPCQPSWLRTQADLHYAHNQYCLALKKYLQVGVIATEYFVQPLTKNIYDESVYKRMIKCCSYLQCHTQVAVLWQILGDDIDYTAVFKALQERNSHDAMDSYYDCIWDTTILEYLIYHHTKRGEFDKRQYVMKLIGQLELNSSNPAEILMEASRVRKARFLRALAKQYL